MLLEVRNLSVCYGVVEALRRVSLAVDEGEIVAVLGPNGAGKSTALKAVSGVLEIAGGRIENGEILFEGASISGYRTDQLVHKKISLVPEGRRLFASMTVLENLQMGAYSRADGPIVKQDIEKMLTLFPRLRERIKQRAGSLSTGEQQMLALARSLMLHPKLILADEPSLGLSPNFVDLIFEKFTEISRSGTSVLLVEQNTQAALQIADRGYVVRLGQVVLEDTGRTLLHDDRIKQMFLGA